MENSLNLQLFERTHRGLIITEAGKSLYQDAKYLIQYSKESLIRAQEAMNHNVINLNFISGYIFCILGQSSTKTSGGVIGDIPTRMISSI